MLRLRSINVQADARVHRCSLSRVSFDFFSLDVSGLLQLAETGLPQAAISCYMGRDLKLTAVGKGLDCLVQKRGGTAYLHMQRSSQEKDAQGNPVCKPNVPIRKLSIRRNERKSDGEPTQSRPPKENARPNTQP